MCWKKFLNNLKSNFYSKTIDGMGSAKSENMDFIVYFKN